MGERHFIDPADGSALTLYRNALLLDPDNGEARQGLQRLAEILFSRVQSALDERKFDVALQALETARSINPDDAAYPRSTSASPACAPSSARRRFWRRSMRRISTARRSSSTRQRVPNRSAMRNWRSCATNCGGGTQEADIANIVKLIDTRLQQDKLIEPRNDSAAYYLNQARAAGASAAALQAQSQEIYKRLTQALHAAIEQRRFADADRVLADLHAFGAPPATTAGLQHDLARRAAQQAAAVPELPQYLDLAQSRLTQGKLTEPDNDSALFYVNQLRAADPRNSGLPRISSAVQAQILEQARAALDAAQPATRRTAAADGERAGRLRGSGRAQRTAGANEARRRRARRKCWKPR